MNEWSVLRCLCEISSVRDDETTDLLPLCRSALEELLQRLKSDADPEDFRVRRAAATEANYRWILRKLSEDDNVASFKAGDVTVTRSASLAVETAKRMQSEAYLAVLPLLQDDNFVFQCV